MFCFFVYRTAGKAITMTTRAIERIPIKIGFIYYINGKPFSLSGIDSETTQQTLTYDTPLEAV